jgi:indolepyruvate decarboxylase
VNPRRQKVPAPLEDGERTQPLDADSFFRILGLTMVEDATVVCDVGDAMLGCHRPADHAANMIFWLTPITCRWVLRFPRRSARWPPIRNRGFTALVGDGAFQMTGMELSTCAKYGMHPIVCILNNDGYGTQRHIIDGPFNDIHAWDYTRICDVLHYGRAMRTRTRGELEIALKEAGAAKEMTISR